MIIPILTTISTNKIYADDAINSPDWIPVISVYDSTNNNPLTVKNYFIRSGSPFRTSYYRQSTGTGHYVGAINYGSVDYIVQTCTHTTASNQSCYVSPVQHDDTFRVDINTYTHTGIATAASFVSTPGLDRYINGDYVVFGVSGFHYDASLISFMASSGMIPSRYFHSSNYNNSIDISGITGWLEKIYDEVAGTHAAFANGFMNQCLNRLYDINNNIDSFKNNFLYGYKDQALNSFSDIVEKLEKIYQQDGNFYNNVFSDFVSKFDKGIDRIIDSIGNISGGGSTDNTLIKNQPILEYWDTFVKGLKGVFDEHLSNIESLLTDIKQGIKDFKDETTNIINNPKGTNFWDFLKEVFTTFIHDFFDTLKNGIKDLLDFTEHTMDLLDRLFRSIGKYIADRLDFLFIPSDAQKMDIKNRIENFKDKSGGIGQLSDSITGYYDLFQSVADSKEVIFTWSDISIPWGVVITGGSFNVSNAIVSGGFSGVQETVKLVFTFSVVVVTVKRCLKHILRMLGVNIQL